MDTASWWTLFREALKQKFFVTSVVKHFVLQLTWKYSNQDNPSEVVDTASCWTEVDTVQGGRQTKVLCDQCGKTFCIAIDLDTHIKISH